MQSNIMIKLIIMRINMKIIIQEFLGYMFLFLIGFLVFSPFLFMWGII